MVMATTVLLLSILLGAALAGPVLGWGRRLDPNAPERLERRIGPLYPLLIAASVIALFRLYSFDCAELLLFGTAYAVWGAAILRSARDRKLGMALAPVACGCLAGALFVCEGSLALAGGTLTGPAAVAVCSRIGGRQALRRLRTLAETGDAETRFLAGDALLATGRMPSQEDRPALPTLPSRAPYECGEYRVSGRAR